MIKKLYIIGNGFDLHHCLKTSYYDFANYLKENHRTLYDTLESYVSYPNSDKDLWSKFEENLANLDAEEFLFRNSNYLPNYSSEEFREGDRYAFPNIMEQHHEMLTTGLFSAFEEFIRQVEYPNYSFEHKIGLDKMATFLTFNYTNPLERLYGIDKNKIVYIHNSAFYGNNRILLGHGIDPETFEEKIPEPPDNLEPEQFEEWYSMNDNYDYSYDEGKKNIMRYFKDTFKPTMEIIEKHSDFFKALISVEEVLVFGHSMSKVDLPYFHKIVKSVNKDAKWTISYYNSKEYKSHLTTLKSLNVERKNITLLELTALQESNKQLKLEFEKQNK